VSTAVLTDSTSDLTAQEQEVFGVAVVPLNVSSGGQMYLDQHNITSRMMFEQVRASGHLPTTTPPTAEQYRAVLERLLERHDHVMSIHLSAKLSRTVEIAQAAAQFYDGRVTVIDSLQSSGALAMQTQRAAWLLRAGTPPLTVAGVVEAVAAQSCTRMGLDTLEYLRRGGRIGAATALLGGILKMKPIIGLHGGRVIPVGRALGQGAKHRQLADELHLQIRRLGPGGARVVIFDNGDPEGVKVLSRVVASEGAELVMRSTLGSVLSAHGGPGVCGFSVEPMRVYHQFRAY
jgi:DegV family protein with EDD domain